MMLRDLIFSVVLITNVFAQNAALNSSGFHGRRELLTSSTSAQKTGPDTSGFDTTYQLSLPKPVQDKNFYLLSLFQRTREVRRLLSQNKALKQLADDKVVSLKKAAGCDNVACVDQLIRFDGPTIEAVAAQLQTLANRPEFKLLAKKDLRASGVFIKYSDQSDAQMLVSAWKDAATGMNRML